MDERVRLAHEDIVHLLIHFGHLAESDARRLLDESGYMDFENDLDRELFFHDGPYYNAMSLLYAKTNPRWFHDRALWPPPKDYIEHLGRDLRVP